MATKKSLMDQYGVVSMNFDEATGNYVNSKTPGTFDGVPTNVTRATAWDGNGKGTAFAGNGYIQFASNPLNTPSKEITMRFKMRARVTADSCQMLGTNNYHWGEYGFAVYLGKVGYMNINYFTGESKTTNIVTFPHGRVNLNDGKWHEIHFNWDGKAGSPFTICVDGIHKYSEVAVRNHGIHTNSLRIGSPANGSTQVAWFTGDIDDFEIYNKSLDISEFSIDRFAIKNDETGKLYTFEAGMVEEITDVNTEGRIMREIDFATDRPTINIATMEAVTKFKKGTVTSDVATNLHEYIGSNYSVVFSKGSSNEFIIDTTTDNYRMYDELEEEVELVSFDANGNKLTDVEYTIESEKSPLDQLNGDYEIVVWSSASIETKPITIEGVPLPQMLEGTTPIQFEELRSLEVTYTESGMGKVNIYLSGDDGLTWRKYRAYELPLITQSEWRNTFSGKALKYRVELSMEEITDVASFSSIKINDRDYYTTQSFTNFLMQVESVVEKTPKIYVSYDNEMTWVPINQNELAAISQEEVQTFTLKIILESGQELYAVTYSWI